MAELSINHVGEQTLTVSTSAVALTKPANLNPRHALIYIGTSPIRWRADGTAPTSTAGMFVPAGAYIDWTEPFTDFNSFISRVQFIRDTTAASDATLEIAYFT